MALAASLYPRSIKKWNERHASYSSLYVINCYLRYTKFALVFNGIVLSNLKKYSFLKKIPIDIDTILSSITSPVKSSCIVDVNQNFTLFETWGKWTDDISRKVSVVIVDVQRSTGVPAFYCGWVLVLDGLQICHIVNMKFQFKWVNRVTYYR